MTPRTTTLVSATVLALILPFAGTAQAPGENFFANWDTNGDGTVTLEEVLERRGVLFDGFDADEDGVLSDAELADHNAMRDAMQAGHDRPDRSQGGWGRQGGGKGYGQAMGRGQGSGRGQAMGRQGMGWQGGPQGQMGPQRGWGYGPSQGGWGYGQPQGYGFGPGPQWGQPGMMPPGWGQPQGMGPQWAPRMGPQGMGPQQRMGPQGLPPQGMGPQGGARGGGQPGMGPQQMHQQMHAGLDGDGDGQITRDEFVQAGEGWLPRFDRNRDGKVDASDFPGAPAPAQ